MLLPAGSYQESLNLFLAVWIYAARQGLLQLSALPGYWPPFANGALQGGGGLPCVPSPLTALLGVGFIPFPGSSETKQLVTPPATVGWAPLQAQPGWGTEPRSVQEPSSHLFVFIYSFFCIHQCRCECVCTGCASAGWWFGCHNVNRMMLALGSGALSSSWVRTSSLFCTTALCK